MKPGATRDMGHYETTRDGKKTRRPMRVTRRLRNSKMGKATMRTEEIVRRLGDSESHQKAMRRGDQENPSGLWPLIDQEI